MSESGDGDMHLDDSTFGMDGEGGYEVFKNVVDTKQLRTVRVAVGPANEQAPGGQRYAGVSQRDHFRGPAGMDHVPNVRRTNSTGAMSDRSGSAGRTGRAKHGPIAELNTDRQKSYIDQNRLKEMRKKKKKDKKERKSKTKLGALSKRTKKLLEQSNYQDDDDRGGNSPGQINFLLATMVTGISYYYVLSLLFILSWSAVCTWYIEEMRLKVDENPEIERWLIWFDEADVRMIGSLFVFSLVFRFNQCYNRWWQGRMLWGDIIQNCLDFSRKVTLWCLDKEYSDRLNRYIVVFPYAAKAQLRGLSLTDESESGTLLVERGFLAQEELDFLRDNPCWEPEFFLDLMRAVVAKIILAQWAREPDEQVLILPHSNRIHDRLFPPLDKAIYDLGNSIGEGVSVRSAGLPRSYDTVHYIFFWIYFLLAPMAEGATIGWLAPCYLGFSACIIMTLMDMGTAMVDPFGTDLVDLPIERFCETIEAQVVTIQRRHKTDTVVEFASHAKAGKEFHSREISHLDGAVNLTH